MSENRSSTKGYKLVKVTPRQYVVLALDEHGQAWNVGRVLRYDEADGTVWLPQPRGLGPNALKVVGSRRRAVERVLEHGQAPGR